MGKKRQRFAGSVTVGERGQVVIPKQIRDLFDISAGDSLLMLADTKQGIAIVKDSAVFEHFSGGMGFGPEGDEPGEAEDSSVSAPPYSNSPKRRT